mgnify:CR=1 FL=1
MAKKADKPETPPVFVSPWANESIWPLKEKYQHNWSGRVESLLGAASEYYWMMNESGLILCDPNPEAEIAKEESLEGIIVTMANERAESVGRELFRGVETDYAAEYLGFNRHEWMVLLVTFGLEEDSIDQFISDMGGLSGAAERRVDTYWNSWVRERAEDALNLCKI